ncbi:MAG: hypothetical protein Q9170_000006 [Blastenia crenularia]
MAGFGKATGGQRSNPARGATYENDLRHGYSSSSRRKKNKTRRVRRLKVTPTVDLPPNFRLPARQNFSVLHSTVALNIALLPGGRKLKRPGVLFDSTSNIRK